MRTSYWSVVIIVSTFISFFVGRSIFLNRDWNRKAIGPGYLGGWEDSSKALFNDIPKWLGQQDAFWLVLGSSSTRESILEQEIFRVRQEPIANLSLHAANFGELLLVYRWVVDHTAPGTKIHLVLGIWYGMVHTEQAQSPHSLGVPGILSVARRFGQFEMSDGRIKERGRSLRQSLQTALIHQVDSYFHIFNLPDYWLSQWDQMNGISRLDSSPSEREAAVKAWNHYLKGGPEEEEQFRAFQTLLDEAERRCDRIQVIELPLPLWHRQGSRWFEPFHVRVADLMKRVRVDGTQIEFLDRSGFLQDDTIDFRDSVHPSAEAAKRVTQDYLRLK